MSPKISTFNRCAMRPIQGHSVYRLFLKTDNRGELSLTWNSNLECLRLKNDQDLQLAELRARPDPLVVVATYGHPGTEPPVEAVEIDDFLKVEARFGPEDPEILVKKDINF